MKNERDIQSVDRRKQLSVLLRRLADLVEHLTEPELDQLLVGDAGLSIARVRSSSKFRSRKDRASTATVNFEEVSRQLIGCGTRDEGMELLRVEVNTRQAVEKLARFLDLPVHRSDTLEILQERIVESEIGSRLRSEAVQGKDL